MPRGHLALTRRSEMGRGRPANTKLSPRATVAVTSRHKSHIWEPHARAPAARPTDPPRPPALAELERTLAHAARGRRGPLTLNSHRAPQWQSPCAQKSHLGTTRARSSSASDDARAHRRRRPPDRPAAPARARRAGEHARARRTRTPARANPKLSPRATVAVTSRHKSHIWEPH